MAKQGKQMLQLSNEESHRLTRESIEQALIFLVNEKSFNSISVTDIVKKAGVSRAAFYKNYKSKEEVLETFVTERTKQIIQRMTKRIDPQDRESFWVGLFEELKKQKQIYRTLFMSGHGETLLRLFNRIPPGALAYRYELDRYQLVFYIGAVYNVINEWMTGGMKESPKKMAKIVAEMIG